MEYRACVEELLFSSQVQHMKSIRHHPGVSCYEHSVFVSYVAWYLAETATALDVELEEVLLQNIEKLKRRYPEGFAAERSIQRCET